MEHADRIAGHGDAGWRAALWVPVIAGGLIMGLALGVRHVQGLFLLPVTLDREWSRETFGLAMAAQNLIWGVAQPFTGMLADKFGSAKVVAVGLVAYGLGLFFMARAADPTGFVLSAGVVVGIALSGTAFGAIYGALSRIMPAERRSWALGLAGAIGGLGQFAMVPAAQGLIGGWGWAGALLILSGAMVLLLPLAMPLRDRSSEADAAGAGLSMSAAIGEALRHKGFWLLNLGFFACGFQLAFIATHLPAYLSDRGLTASEGVAALAIIALTNVAGTYLLGVWGGMLRRKYLLAALYVVRTLAMALFIFTPLTITSTYLFAAVMGFLWLGTVPLTNGLVSQVFGVRYITTLFGFVFFGHQLGSFFGVWLGGYLFVTTGSYQAVWLIAMGVGVLAAVVHWPIDDRAIARPSPAPAAA
ncbi:MFS transporter [Aquabacter sp. L1I39]|uniref:MFS transporter n=1 Tax=Aquabacter sp. L1I39 TaxID=2820278 RepID=UPI001FFCCF5F|nr:MFS transporter [Aquabacter sp. L1I39]